jgi:hypothetical protein
VNIFGRHFYFLTRKNYFQSVVVGQTSIENFQRFKPFDQLDHFSFENQLDYNTISEINKISELFIRPRRNKTMNSKNQAFYDHSNGHPLPSNRNSNNTVPVPNGPANRLNMSRLSEKLSLMEDSEEEKGKKYKLLINN